MAMFVHLAPESRVALIRRNGIVDSAGPPALFPVGLRRSGYAKFQCFPPVAARIEKCNQGPIAAIYFRVLDDERVWVGHYNQAHRWMAASVAVGELMAAEDGEAGKSSSRGAFRPARYTRLVRSASHRMAVLSDAKGKPPFCTCRFCIRGEMATSAGAVGRSR